jgi:hypothetical protein
MGRPFLRRLIDLTMGVAAPTHYIRLTRDARKDIAAWILFLQHFNGSLLMRHPQWSSSDTIKLYTDASNLGFAAVFGACWSYGTWPPVWLDYHITIKEMYPITLAVHLWGNLLANHRIVFLTDNQAVALVHFKTVS